MTIRAHDEIHALLALTERPVGVETWQSAYRLLRPGGHLAVAAAPAGAHRVGIAVEDAGFEIRDSIHVDFGGGGHTLVILARKPFTGTAAANTLAYGTSGLNINAARIPFTSLSDQDAAKPQGQTTSKPAALGVPGATEERPRSVFTPTKVDGRWPANTILAHTPECRQTGERVVRSDSHHPGSRGPSGMFSGEGGALNGQDELDERSPRHEVVQAWDCVSDCPVFRLDAQSGATKGGTWNRTAGARPFNNGGEPTRHVTVGTDASVGGASRFFKTLTSGDVGAELADYLRVLLVPADDGAVIVI